MKVERLRVLRQEEVSEEDYLPTTEKDRQALAEEILRAGRSFENEHLRGALRVHGLDQDFWTAFCEAPAAKGCTTRGWAACWSTRPVACESPAFWRRSTPWTATCCSSGRSSTTWARCESSPGMPAASRTPRRDGVLGHVVLGERLVASHINALPGFPEELALRISHVLLSHQGETEYGSPEQPKTLEALLVHLMDNLDARAAMYLESQNVDPRREPL